MAYRGLFFTWLCVINLHGQCLAFHFSSKIKLSDIKILQWFQNIHTHIVLSVALQMTTFHFRANLFLFSLWEQVNRKGGRTCLFSFPEFLRRNRFPCPAFMGWLCKDAVHGTDQSISFFQNKQHVDFQLQLANTYFADPCWFVLVCFVFFFPKED